MKKSFETEVRNLEAKVTRLEEKVEHQGLLLHNLTEKLEASNKKLTLSKNVESSDGYGNQQAYVIYRTCHEAHAADSSLKSGMYWIDPDDPDGHGIGDDPIHVHCNMTTGNN